MRLCRRAALLTVAVSLLGGAAELVRAQDSEPGKETAAASLALDLIGPPDGAPLSGAELDRVTEEVSSLMRCPVCQGLSVADSPTTSALAMREEARDLLASGYSGEQVLSYFERSYGEFIRLSPKPEGFNLVVWILPVVALIAGALLIAGGARRRARSAATAGSDEAEDGSASGGPGKGRPEADKAPEIPADLAAYTERVRREVSE